MGMPPQPSVTASSRATDVDPLLICCVLCHQTVLVDHVGQMICFKSTLRLQETRLAKVPLYSYVPFGPENL
jgi:hypothetical protein